MKRLPLCLLSALVSACTTTTPFVANSMSPFVPVSPVSEPTPSVPVSTWLLDSSKSVRDHFRQWAKEQQWDLQWQVDDDYRVTQTTTLRGVFPDSLAPLAVNTGLDITVDKDHKRILVSPAGTPPITVSGIGPATIVKRAPVSDAARPAASANPAHPPAALPPAATPPGEGTSKAISSDHTAGNTLPAPSLTTTPTDQSPATALDSTPAAPTATPDAATTATPDTPLHFSRTEPDTSPLANSIRMSDTPVSGNASATSPSVPQQWWLDSSKTLEHNLNRWARDAAMNPVMWDVATPYVIARTTPINGDLTSALRQVAEASRLNICLFRTDKTIRVTPPSRSCRD